MKAKSKMFTKVTQQINLTWRRNHAHLCMEQEYKYRRQNFFVFSFYIKKSSEFGKYSGQPFGRKFKMLKITFSKFSFFKTQTIGSQLYSEIPENVVLKSLFWRFRKCNFLETGISVFFLTAEFLIPDNVT